MYMINTTSILKTYPGNVPISLIKSTQQVACQTGLQYNEVKIIIKS